MDASARGFKPFELIERYFNARRFAEVAHANNAEANRPQIALGQIYPSQIIDSDLGAVGNAR
jgi:hypothetical protein